MILETGSTAWNLLLRDPDDFARLVQVRDWLSGQAWNDVTQYRVDPPFGLKTHWSRLGDLPLGLTILALRPFVGGAVAEQIAIVGVPLLLLLLLMLLSCRIAARLAGSAGAAASAFLLATAPMILAQFVPGRIDHHGLQILSTMAIVAALTGAATARNGIIAGIGLSCSALIGLETAPVLAAIGLWVAGRWIVVGRPARNATAGFAIGLAALPLLFALLTPPYRWSETYSDAVGLGHIFAATSFALLLGLSCRFQTNEPRFVPRLTLIGLGGLLIGSATLLFFPELLSEPYAELDPFLQRLWIDRIIETNTIIDKWRAGAAAAVVSRIGFISVAAAMGIWLAIRAKGDRRDRHVLVAVLAVVGFILACWQQRSVALATTIAIPAASVALALLWTWSQQRFLPAFAAGAMVLSPLFPLALGDAMRAARPPENPVAVGGASRKTAQCLETGAPNRLSELPSGLALSSIGLGPKLLALTDLSVVAYSNHRDAHGNLFAYRTLLAPPETARELIRRRGIRYVILCPTAPEEVMLAADSRQALISRLLHGDVPAWLEPVPGDHGGLLVFRAS